MNCGNDIGPSEAFRERRDERGQVVAEHVTRLYFDECAKGVQDKLQEMGFCIATMGGSDVHVG